MAYSTLEATAIVGPSSFQSHYQPSKALIAIDNGVTGIAECGITCLRLLMPLAQHFSSPTTDPRLGLVSNPK